MVRVLVTAFEAYDVWPENASWLALVELTKDLPASPKVVTRRYPVDFGEMQKRLSEDLADQYDFALHLGQAPGLARIHLESVAINVGGNSHQSPEQYQTLVDDGPAAYRAQLPLAQWSSLIRQQGIPAQVSYHAGTYLCNATLYMSHYLAQQQGLKTRSTFLHLPLDVSQTVQSDADLPALPSALSAQAVRVVLEQLVVVS